MAERNEEIASYVRERLAKNPDLGSRELYDTAQERFTVDDTLQQFHARYVLPIKRAGGASRGRKTKARAPRGKTKRQAEATTTAGTRGGTRRKSTRGRKTAATGSERDQIRAVFMDFAREFAAAESRGEIVRVLSEVDGYVDRVASAAK